jgi:hypothetical protein
VTVVTVPNGFTTFAIERPADADVLVDESDEIDVADMFIAPACRLIDERRESELKAVVVVFAGVPPLREKKKEKPKAEGQFVLLFFFVLIVKIQFASYKF